MGQLVGIWNRPYIDLEPYLETAAFPALHDEICAGLARASEVRSAGGSLKWMGVTAPWVEDDGYADFMRVIEGFTREELSRFVALGDEPPASFDLERQRDYRFGDEQPHPLSRAQVAYLRYRYGAYFPWKVVYELLSERTWDDKNSGEGKHWNEEALRLFPRTVAFIRALPLVEIGRCIIFGLDANDHAPEHRDTPPSDAAVAHCITIAPGGPKHLYLVDPDRERRVDVTARAYWFNDMDYHGVAPAKVFQYSVRVDGRFEPAFFERLRRDHR